jgi:phenylalanyl-tRNA synthetase beta chain
LLPGMLDALHHNVNHKSADLALFEVGRVFTKQNDATREERRLAMAFTGNRHAAFWSGTERDAKFDIYDLKGAIEEFLDHLGIRVYQRRPEPAGIFIESATILLGKQSLGELGQVSPLLAKRYDLRDVVVIAEFYLDLLLARRAPAKTFKELPNFPAIRRDVAMIVPENTTHEAVASAIKQSKAPNLETVQLFDVFRGKNVPPGQKSVAYAFIYRHSERTLTDAEANSAHEKVVAQLKQSIGAAIRE